MAARDLVFMVYGLFLVFFTYRAIGWLIFTFQNIAFGFPVIANSPVLVNLIDNTVRYYQWAWFILGLSVIFYGIIAQFRKEDYASRY